MSAAGAEPVAHQTKTAAMLNTSAATPMLPGSWSTSGAANKQLAFKLPRKSEAWGTMTNKPVGKPNLPPDLVRNEAGVLYVLRSSFMTFFMSASISEDGCPHWPSQKLLGAKSRRM